MNFRKGFLLEFYQNMFDPINFLKLSEKLLNDFNDNCEEAFYRTIVSRAYYSVYLSCREFLKKHGKDVDRISKKSKKSVHSILPKLIQETTRRYYLFDFIYELKSMRIKSDYDLDLSINRTDAERSVEIAKTILEDLEII